MKYRICYIDGHDLRYKTFVTEAENREAAIKNLRDLYSTGDFDHQIASVIKEET